MSKETNFSMAAILLSVMFILFTANIQAQSPHQFGPSYLPQRVYDSKEKRFSDFEAMMADLSRIDVVFVGEKHDDPATHKLEQAILTGLLRRKVGVSVSLEMFERDVQQTLDNYLTGKLGEEEFLKTSRPWPNYAADYRPLVEMARAHQWPVVAANVPRKYASQVSRQGLTALNALPEAERKMAAAQFQCPFDDYFKKFSEVMNSHPGGDSNSAQKDEKKEAEMRAMTEKFYFAQCVKDETMAESISAHFDQIKNSPTKSVIVHYNGSFHSDNKLGTATRFIRRQPKAKVKIISIVPVNDLDSIKPDGFRKLGDYVIFCLQPAKAKDASAN
ncbi:MAG TPA: ChaN family lipoprotein [Blastocatellia bacterium]|nr:ChaN family lipoprotein [Blastocatellia bacterium]